MLCIQNLIDGVCVYDEKVSMMKRLLFHGYSCYLMPCISRIKCSICTLYKRKHNILCLFKKCNASHNQHFSVI